MTSIMRKRSDDISEPAFLASCDKWPVELSGLP